ncbi:MAG: DUF922 domain-containing protein [Sphingobacteriales bacterium]|nr:MAG: DUF922 domain-containing protein [Sphingobacteriales bacterium]
MREKKSAGLVIMVCLFTLIAAKVNAHNPNNSRTSAVSSIVVLKENERIPGNATPIESMELEGNKNATFRDVLEEAKSQARASGANLIKINRHVKRSAGNPSDKLNVTFYNVEDAHAYEHEMTWQKYRKLTWDDFRGPIPADADDITAAATFCGIGFETNTISTTNNDLRIKVYNTFYTSHSWVRPEERNDRVLAHEQGHFDLCELYTRKLRQRMNSVQVNVHNLKSTLRNIYEEVQREYRNRQEAYEQETQHGVVEQEQLRWQRILERELSFTDALATM